MRPCRLGAGNRPDTSRDERNFDGKLDFHDPNGTWLPIRIQIGDGELEVIEDPEGTPTLIGTIPGGGSLSFPCEDMTAGGTLDAGTRAAICDETGVTLPAAPADGAFVHLRNVGTAATVGRNGENIDGAAADYSLAAGASVLLVYHAATFGGWRSFPGSGSGGGGGGAPYITGIATLGETGVAYSWTPTLNNPGSTRLWEITDGALPAGLAIDATTGEVSGTPTDGGTYPYEMAATILTGTGAGATSYSRQRAVVDFPGLTPTRTSSCTLWLDFTDPRTMFLPDGVTPVSANDDEIYRMQDKANPSDRWRGGSEGASFAYKTNVINGASSGNTVGAGRYMNRVGGRTMGEIITASAFTYIVVVRTQGVTTTNTDFAARQIIGDATQYNGLLYSTASSGQHFIYNWDGNDDYARITGLGQNTFRLITAQHVGGQIRIRINGGSWTSSASGNTTNLAGEFFLGFGNTTPGGTIDFCQVACFNAALPDAELEDVEFYLANTVGISL